jgi:hypothetical protein
MLTGVTMLASAYRSRNRKRGRTMLKTALGVGLVGFGLWQRRKRTSRSRAGSSWQEGGRQRHAGETGQYGGQGGRQRSGGSQAGGGGTTGRQSSTGGQTSGGQQDTGGGESGGESTGSGSGTGGESDEE